MAHSSGWTTGRRVLPMQEAGQWSAPRRTGYSLGQQCSRSGQLAASRMGQQSCLRAGAEHHQRYQAKHCLAMEGGRWDPQVAGHAPQPGTLWRYRVPGTCTAASTPWHCCAVAAHSRHGTAAVAQKPWHSRHDTAPWTARDMHSGEGASVAAHLMQNRGRKLKGNHQLQEQVLPAAHSCQPIASHILGTCARAAQSSAHT